MNGVSPIERGYPYYEIEMKQGGGLPASTLEAIIRISTLPSDSLIMKLLHNASRAHEAVGRNIDRLA